MLARRGWNDFWYMSDAGRRAGEGISAGLGDGLFCGTLGGMTGFGGTLGACTVSVGEVAGVDTLGDATGAGCSVARLRSWAILMYALWMSEP